LRLLICESTGALLWGYPKYKVWYKRQAGQAELAEAEFSRQIAIVEAEAKEKSAEALGNAEIIRATKLAEANKILGESLKGNDEY
jgi:regulator of protease activity HflC (stomatin/prohibitin superfamily)